MNIKELTTTLEFAHASKEFMDAKQSEGEAKDKYQMARNKWMGKEIGINKYGAEKAKWLDVVNNPGFQKATGDLYDAYQDAKRERTKAQSRMLTRYRKLSHETMMLSDRPTERNKPALRAVGKGGK